MSILAIDAGTTGVTALVVTAEGTIAARGYQEFPQHFPKPGWVEHAPEEIWQATLEATALPRLRGTDGRGPAGVGITNQRETVVLWDRETLSAPRRAIVWQDRRTADICRRMREEGHEERITELTGLRLDPTSPAPSSCGWPRTSRTRGRWSRTAATRSARSTPT